MSGQYAFVSLTPCKERALKFQSVSRRRQQDAAITKTNPLTLVEEVIVAYSDDHMKPAYNLSGGKNAEIAEVKVGGTYNYRCLLKC
jgi:hypothetical protein